MHLFFLKKNTCVNNLLVCTHKWIAVAFVFLNIYVDFPQTPQNTSSKWV